MFSLKLGTQLRIAFAVVLLIPFTVATFYSTFYYSNKIEQEALHKIASDLKVAELLYKTKLQSMKDLAQTFMSKKSLGTFTDLGLFDRLERELVKQLPQDGNYVVTVLDKTGKVLALSSKAVSEEIYTIQNAYIQKALQAEISVGSEYLMLEDFNQAGIKLDDLFGGTPPQHFLTLTASSPLHSPDGDIIGVFLIRLLLNNNHAFTEEVRQLLDYQGVKVEVALHGKEGSFITGTQQRGASTQGAVDQLSPSILDTVIQKKETLEEANISSGGHLAKYQPILGIEGAPVGILMVQTGVETYLHTRDVAILTMSAIAFFGFIFALLSGLIFSRRIVSGLEQLTQGTALIANGDYSHELEISSQDEIGQLANSFQVMKKRLRESFEKIGQQNQEIKNQNVELKRLDKLKDEFLANTSHELRTPLNGIIGIGESMLDGAGGSLTEAQSQNMQLVVQSGQRLFQMVNDILDHSKMQHRELQVELRPIDIYQVSKSVVALSEALLGPKKLELINNISPETPLIQADADRMSQVFTNLIGNAIKFTESGSITLSSNVKENFLEISVSDTGIGIAREKQERIFESFEQADGSTSRTYGGTGLGLSIAKSFVELHHGSIYLESKDGEGSTFFFTIPLSDDQNRENLKPIEVERPVLVRQFRGPQTEVESFLQDDQNPSDTGHKIQNAKTILIVDDEPVNMQVLINHLSLKNYKTFLANDGFEALESIESRAPDLVLLDLMMPKMSGYEVCQKVRKKYSASDLPIIMLTAKDQIVDLVRGLQYGANDYLTKPFHKEELLARVNTHLQLAEVNRALVEAKQRLEQLFVSTRGLAASRYKRNCMLDAINAILQQIPIQPSAFVRLAFWQEQVGTEKGYAAFQGTTSLLEQGGMQVSRDQLAKLEHFPGTTDIIEVNKGHELAHLSQSAFKKEQLCIPIWQRDQMLGYIEMESVLTADIKSGHLEFVDTLSQSLAVILENISFINNLEYKVSQQTQEIQKVYSELEERHEQLKQTQTQLVQSEKMASLGTLVAGVAHEINNPTNYVNNGALNMERHLERLELLIMELTEEEEEAMSIFEPKLKPLRENLQAIIEGTHRIGNIVADLRVFSRLDEAEQKKADIVDGLKSTLGIIEPNFRKSVRFICDFRENQMLECWPAQLNQVFMNLIINGCQAIVEKKEAEQDETLGDFKISTFIKKDTFGISFQDSGVGISEEVINRIFDPFFTTKEIGQGTGLGLSISYGIVEKHNGQIFVDSTPGKGSSFVVSLPLSKTE